MSEIFTEQINEPVPYAVEPRNAGDHHLDSEQGDLKFGSKATGGTVTESPQYGLVKVGDQRVLVGVLHFSISGCNTKVGTMVAGSCSGQGYIAAKTDSLLSSGGPKAIRQGDQGTCIGVGQLAAPGTPPVLVMCDVCVSRSMQEKAPTAAAVPDLDGQPTIAPKSEDGLTESKEVFHAKLVYDDGTPVEDVLCRFVDSKGASFETRLDANGEAFWESDAETCDIEFPEVDLSIERPLGISSHGGFHSTGQFLRRGTQSADVRLLQIRLNVILNSRTLLEPDGIFGQLTEKVVRRFQENSALSADGIVGPLTRAALAEPPKAQARPKTAKFVSRLGVVTDFVSHFAIALEACNGNLGLTFKSDEVTDFFSTSSGARYLLVKHDPVRVIDFRHFFAAAALAYNNAQDAPLGGSDGKAELVGVGNEIAQCLHEAVRLKINSCFSPEDLGSNRLGAEFAHKLRQSPVGQSPEKVLADLLMALTPMLPHTIATAKLQNRWDLFLEALAGILHGLDDLFFPEAW